jgi:Ureidoglycolate hydrolase
MKDIQYITQENFAAFGTVIEFPKHSEEQFLILETEEKEPWRLAIFRYANREISVIECHPTSKESFEPLSGITVLVVATNDKPDEYQAFILDKPVCLGKGIWHQVLSLTEEAQVKITENLEVESVFHHLEKPIKVQIG